MVQSRSRYSWSSAEIEEAEGAAVLLAADVIYGDELTDLFFGIVEGLMARGSEKVERGRGQQSSSVIHESGGKVGNLS